MGERRATAIGWVLMVAGLHGVFAALCLGAWAHYYEWERDVVGWVMIAVSYSGVVAAFGFRLREKALASGADHG